MDQRRVKRFLEQLTPLLNEWDPIGVVDADPLTPTDEYECLKGLVLSCVLDCVPAAEAVDRIVRRVREHTRVDAGRGSTRRLVRRAPRPWGRVGPPG